MLKYAVSLRAAFSSETGEIFPGVQERSEKPQQRQPTSWFCFVQIVKRIFQRHASNAAEPGLLAKLANLRFMKTERAESCAMVRERRGHAVEHADAMKHCAERIRVLLEFL